MQQKKTLEELLPQTLTEEMAEIAWGMMDAATTEVLKVIKESREFEEAIDAKMAEDESRLQDGELFLSTRDNEDLAFWVCIHGHNVFRKTFEVLFSEMIEYRDDDELDKIIISLETALAKAKSMRSLHPRTRS